MEVNIGGERLGSGSKMTARGRTYERSTHDLSATWRSTMAPGTLVPFMNIVGLPGDTMDINLGCEVLTHPTIGPLFGSYKVQLDVFKIPMRLFQGKLHMNLLNVGLNMKEIKLPVVLMKAQEPINEIELDGQQINPSCLYSYLGIKGLGTRSDGLNNGVVGRTFNALPLLNYWAIYKQYYANKQENIGVVIHKDVTIAKPTIVTCELIDTRNGAMIQNIPINSGSSTTFYKLEWWYGLRISCNVANDKWNWLGTILNVKVNGELTNPVAYDESVGKIWTNVNIDNQTDEVVLTGITPYYNRIRGITFNFVKQYAAESDEFNMEESPILETFPLENIDTMRKEILRHVTESSAYEINENTFEPYGLPLQEKLNAGGRNLYSKQWGQEGLALKTYQSDLFNNWIDTEWIDGVDGISDISAVQITNESFTIDALNLSQKIYNLLNRVAMSGGSYDDWLDAVYTHERFRGTEEPVYEGGLIKEIVFQEVINQASAQQSDPLGTLAGKGRMADKHKGGQIIVKCDEPCYVMGIVSITPRICYSQGNRWDTNILTLDDYHKPALDVIGYQDLITDQMAWWDTSIGNDGTIVKYSAGKQPAWINYMTDYDEVFGNFAIQTQQMFMVLNRRYEMNKIGGQIRIKDLTTYIDPVKYNNIFADTRIDAQNFWVNIGKNIIVRRKISAKVIPNL